VLGCVVVFWVGGLVFGLCVGVVVCCGLVWGGWFVVGGVGFGLGCFWFGGFVGVCFCGGWWVFVGLLWVGVLVCVGVGVFCWVGWLWVWWLFVLVVGGVVCCGVVGGWLGVGCGLGFVVWVVVMLLCCGRVWVWWCFVVVWLCVVVCCFCVGWVGVGLFGVVVGCSY
jgi:hypothetical protein